MSTKQTKEVRSSKKQIGEKKSTKNENGLRLHWLTFIREYIASEGNGTEAYMRAYPGVSRETARNNGARLLANACIRDEINCRYDQQRATEAWIIANLMTMVKGSVKNPMAAVKSLEILARIKGMLTDTKKIEFSSENPAVFMPICSLEEAEKLNALIGNKRIIE